MEFSKKIFAGISIGAISLTVFACMMVWKTDNLEPLRYLIPAVFTELSVATGFYFNKAKAENTIKIKKGGDNYDERV